MNARNILTFMVIMLSLFLGGCSTIGGPSVSTPFEKARAMTDAEWQTRQKEVAEIIKTKQRLDGEQDQLLRAGLPVEFEVGGIKMTRQWDKQFRRMNFYDGHATGKWGSEALLILSVLTKADSPDPEVTINKVTGKPEFTVFAGNVSVQETMARAVMKGIVGWGGPALNGVVSATVLKDAIASSAANSNAPTTVTTTVDLGCFNCTTITP